MSAAHATMAGLHCPAHLVELQDPPREGHTRSRAWLASGNPLVLIEGATGGIVLSHVEVIAPRDAARDPAPPRRNACGRAGAERRPPRGT
jgi:hypothetical protein